MDTADKLAIGICVGCLILVAVVVMHTRHTFVVCTPVCAPHAVRELNGDKCVCDTRLEVRQIGRDK